MIVGATDALTAHGAFFPQEQTERSPVQWFSLARLDYQGYSELRYSGITSAR